MAIDRGVLAVVILVMGAIVVWVAGGIISIYRPDNATPQQAGDFRLLPTQDDLRRYRSVLALAVFVCLAIVVLTTETVQDEIRKVLASDDYGIPKFHVENYCDNVPLVFGRLDSPELCIAAEQFFYRQLKDMWFQIPIDVRKSCVESIPRAYSKLDVCIVGKTSKP